MRGRWTFPETIQYLDELSAEPIVPAAQAGLQRIRWLLEQLGNPERSFRSVHVTGSCGKGSTTTMIGRIIQSAGFRTGYFRSPHLESYRERIAVGDEYIAEDAWCEQFHLVAPLVERMRASSIDNYVLGRPSFSEILFAMACLHFRDQGVEWAAIETGMGGRLDATNILQPAVAVITNVSLEHTQILGESVAQIAVEKAAIIKGGAAAVTGSRDEEALQVIARRAEEVGAHLSTLGRDFDVSVEHQGLTAQRIEIRAWGEEFTATLPLAGRFQAQNAGVAAAAALALAEADVKLSQEVIIEGLETVEVPGRMELVGRHPLVLLDGAHNPLEAAELAASVRELLPGKSITLLFASMNDKDIELMAGELGSIADAVFVTLNPGTERAANLVDLAAAFERHAGRVTAIAEASLALDQALKATRDALLVCGSLYLVGALRPLLLKARTPV